MKVVHILWRVYRLAVFPALYTLSGGGPQVGCRHQPSCSVYAVQVIERDGWFKGVFLAIFRVLKCNPFFKGTLGTNKNGS